LKEIILIGGGGHCVSCIDVIEMQNSFKIVGIIDKKENIGKKVLGYEILGTDDDIQELSKSIQHFFITLGQIGSPEVRINILKRCKDLDIVFPNITSPLAYISRHSTIGSGTIVMHNAVVNACARVGNHCIINSKSLIEHDAIIEDFCHIATGAIVNGGTRVGKESFLGSASVCKQGSNIPEGSFIKANSLVK
jgi:sugar O-acyltransferase (sialic acid O-acetyltransferase NeuD family)